MGKGAAGQRAGTISGKGGYAKQTPAYKPSKVSVKGASVASKSFRKLAPIRGKSKASGLKGLVTGGSRGWSGASGSAGGTAGKTYGGVKATKGVLPSQKASNSIKPPKMTGHTAGQIRGNMMAHSKSTVPFQNTGMQPGRGKILEVPTSALTSSQAKAPGAQKLDSGYKAKLQASLPYNMPGTTSWSGASGTAGGTAGKTYGKGTKRSS